MLATLRRYSTASAGLGAASAANKQTATAASARPSVVIEPPGRGMGDVSGIIPSPGRGREGMRKATRSGVEVFAGRGRGPAHPVPLFAQQELVEPDRAALEGHGRAREVEEPGAVDALAHDGARLVGASLEPLDPLAAGARVVQPQVLEVDDFPAGALDLCHRLRDAGEVAVRKDMLVEKIRLAGPLPVELVMDAVVEVEPAVVEHLADAAEERGVVRDAHVLDNTNGSDLVVAGARRQVAVVTVLDEAAPLETFALDARGGPVGLRLRQRHPVRRDAVVLRGPDGEAAPAAADVEKRLPRLEPELAADEIDLVLLRLLELAVGVAVVGARVEHERVEEQGVEIVRHVVVVRNGLGVPPL